MPISAAYLGIVIIWSTTPLAIQWSAQGAGFAFAVFARMAIGALLAAALVAIWRVGFPLHRRARKSYLVGGLGLFGAMGLTYWGARFVHSGLVSVLFGLSPLMTSVLATFWLGERSMTRLRLAGMTLGVAGLAVIFVHGSGTDGSAVGGLAALLLAVLIYSASLVWLKHIDDDSPPLATTVGTLAVSLPLFAAVWLITDGRVPEAMPSRAGAAIVYLGVFGSVLGFALYYHVIKHMDAGRVALITLITPVLALLLGHVLNGEQIGIRVWGGAALIGLGLALHQWEESALSSRWAAVKQP
jgi:drug/metabolite transporter (DMT)-like permease